MDPTQHPPQPPPEVFVPQPKPNKFKIFLFIVFINTLFSIISYLYLQNQRLKKQFTQPQITPTAPPNAKYLFSQPTDETAGWKTYTNSELGYELKYPPNWKSVTDCKFGTTCFSSENFEQTVNEAGEGGGFYITKKGGLFSISTSSKDDVMDLNSYCHPGGPLLISSCVDTKLEGIDAKKRVLNIQDGTEYATEIGTLTNKFLVILGQNYSSQSDKKILDQILSTFKFVNQDNQNTCVNDSDCGVNICDCKADLEKNILVKDKICTRHCPGIPKCISSKCILIK